MRSVGRRQCPKQTNRQTDRVTRPTPRFTIGDCVSRKINRSSPGECWDAYNQFKLIERSLPADCLVAYTDGSVKARRGGAGVAVFLRGRPLHEIISSLGDYPIG